MNNSKLIPIPKKYHSEHKTRKIVLQLQCEVEQWKSLLEAFVTYAKKIYGITFVDGTEGLQIVLDESLDKNAYVVDTYRQPQIFASDIYGCAYALATVLQLMQEEDEIEIARIEDYPDKEYRGLMVDLAREWHPFYTLLNYVDLCFFTR